MPYSSYRKVCFGAVYELGMLRAGKELGKHYKKCEQVAQCFKIQRFCHEVQKMRRPVASALHKSSGGCGSRNMSLLVRIHTKCSTNGNTSANNKTK